jgi:RHS repeat-associated protein
LTHSGGKGISIPLSYNYDPVGNRTMTSTPVAQALTTQAVSNSYDNGNRLTSSTASGGTTNYSYDDNGNLISAAGPSGTTSYTWDSRNRLISVAAAGQTTTFLYDFVGNLISENQSGSVNLTQTFVLDDLTDVAYVGRSNGDNLSVLAGRSIDQHLGVAHSSGQTEYGLSDAINSTAATADQSGKLLASFFYEPFGQTTNPAGSGYPFQFTGRVPETGTLYYYRARFYNSTAGRFISEDPIGFLSGDVNSYRYVRNDPPNRTDAFGLVGPVEGLQRGFEELAEAFAEQGDRGDMITAFWLGQAIKAVRKLPGTSTFTDAIDTLFDPCLSVSTKILKLTTLPALGYLAEQETVLSYIYRRFGLKPAEATHYARNLLRLIRRGKQAYDFVDTLFKLSGDQ